MPNAAPVLALGLRCRRRDRAVVVAATEAALWWYPAFAGRRRELPLRGVRDHGLTVACRERIVAVTELEWSGRSLNRRFPGCMERLRS